MRYLAKILLLTVCMIALIGVTAACDSPGYWKSHPEKWPVEMINIGGHDYTKDEAIKIMQNSVSGDMTYAMFNTLVAAKLNGLIYVQGNFIKETLIPLADGWLGAHALGSGVKGSSSEWQSIEPVYVKIDNYNNELPL